MCDSLLPLPCWQFFSDESKDGLSLCLLLENMYKETLLHASIPISSIEGPSKPGEKDEEVFDCTHPSNLFWKEWAWDQRVQKYGGGTGGSWRAFGSVLDNTVADKFSDDPEYWAYHCGRSLAFASQGALSLSLHSLRQTLSNSSDDKRGSVFGLPDNIHKACLTAHRLFSEALFVFTQDREHIRNGFYKRPWDMEDKRGRQYNPVWIARRMPII